MPSYRTPGSNYYRPSLFGGFTFFPPVIKYLLVSNVAVYFLARFFAFFTVGDIPLEPYIEKFLYLFPLGHGFAPWQLLTYMFMHGGIGHLLFNMLALWMFGMQLENTWGSKKFLSYYLICGIGAGISNLLVTPLFAGIAPTVGASGAIYGVLIAFGMLFPDQPIYVYFLLPIRARYFVLIYIGLELFNGVTGTSDGVAHFAHLGGAAVGLLYMMLDGTAPALPDMFKHRGGPRFMSRDEYPPSQRAPRYTQDVSDASYYDVKSEEDRVSQQKIDEILDKISQHGYANLTEDEKRILFDASKKLN